MSGWKTPRSTPSGGNQRATADETRLRCCELFFWSRNPCPVINRNDHAVYTVRLLVLALSLVLVACQPTPTSGVVVASADEVRDAIADSPAPVKVVKFWATWCASCLADMPGFIELAADRPDDMELIFVSMDTEAQREEAEAVLNGHGWAARSFLRSGSDYAFMRTVTPRWTGALPATALYLDETDPAQFWEGQTDYETLSIRVDHLLAR